MARTRLTKLALAAALLALAASAAPAHAEQAQSGDLIVAFHGGIGPLRLPRTEPAPVSVRMGGKIKTTDHTVPPKLERVVLAINGNGAIDTAGLPRCPLGKLHSISSSQAKRVCGAALIGHGNVTSRVTLPAQGAFASNGDLLAFNGRYKGRTAVFAQVASTSPLPLTYVIVFELRKGKGTFGTSLVADLPPIASGYGSISAFDIAFGRTYTYRGEKHSYASAACPAPKGFPGALFPFAKASYSFADGRTLSSTLVRQCKVRGK
jgi:hypothetical protein